MADIIIQGNIGRTPELRYTQSGAAVLSVSIAENRRDKDGNTLGTDWYEAVLWHADAATWAGRLEKGTYVRAVGRLQVEQYDGDDGTKRVRVKLHDAAIRTFPKRDGETHRAPDPQEPPRAQPRPAAPSYQAQAEYRPDQGGVSDDDPFGDQ